MAYRHAFESEDAVLVCRFAEPVDARCYAEHLDVLENAVRSYDRRQGDRRLAVLAVFDGRVSPPDAKTRQRVAEVTSRVDFNPYIAIVTDNPLFRGVLTALSWVRKQRHEHYMTATVEEGVAWLAEKSGVNRVQLREMLRRTAIDKREAG